MDNFIYQSQVISEVVDKHSIADIKKNYKKISEKYREQKTDSSIIVSSDEQVLSYISSRMGETSVIVFDALKKLNNIVDIKKEIYSVLDLGSGTGSVFWALSNFLETAAITAIEKQASMIKYSKILSQNLGFNIEYINTDVTSSKLQDLTNYDLTIESFMLNEMNDADRRSTIDLMCNKAKKYIILVEPGTPKSYENMMKDREYLLSKGLKMVLPCPHSEKCGLSDDYCNFSVRINRTKTSRLVKNATLNYEDEKYFYLIFSKEVMEYSKNSIVLRKPVYKKNQVELKLCNQDQTVTNTIVAKNNKQAYLKAKKLKHGDVFKF